MRWRKLGLVYCPDGSQWWARSYAHIPTAYVLDDSRIRVYYAGLDENKFGRVGYVDVDAANPLRVLEIGQEPVLDLGELGAFDDSGVVPSCMIDVGQQKYLYYVGWQRVERVPFMLYTGLAISDDGLTFRRFQRVPVLERTDSEPFLRTASWVLQEDGLFKMWYLSNLKWTPTPQGPHYNVVIKFATSADGNVWQARDQNCLEPDFVTEYAVGRPCVIHDSDMYRMWYSIRSHDRPYRIGYAESPDGLNWERLDSKAGIAASETGWDSEMICYPCVVDCAGRRYLFYNGNRHGQSGFGCAVLED